MNPPLTRAAIDLRAVSSNIRALRAATRPEARLMAVVKANAYGHGSVPVAETALSSGADALGVARLEEGVHLRNAGISAPILVFGHIAPDDAEMLLRHNLTATVYSLQGAEHLSREAQRLRGVIRVHLKIDTGMGRLGLLPDRMRHTGAESQAPHLLLSDITKICALPGLEFEGIYTHFATADSPDRSYAERQLLFFMETLQTLKKNGIEFQVRHAANSGALLTLPESHLDMVRPGISIYGYLPDPGMEQTISLTPALSVVTRIMHLKQVPSGFKVSYGCTYETKHSTLIATLPVGYADGYSRANSGKGKMLVRGEEARVAGRVCMDLTMLDVGHIRDVAVGDNVVLLGKQGDKTISADDIAADLGTISYEILTSIASRVPRIYPLPEGK